jgi:hypothetical protein
MKYWISYLLVYCQLNGLNGNREAINIASAIDHPGKALKQRKKKNLCAIVTSVKHLSSD